MTNHDTPLRPSERLRIALIDEGAEIERMAGQAADMVVAARAAADAERQRHDVAEEAAVLDIYRDALGMGR